jgi:AAHS family 4-hydroxybenzoate transporter-like MFS transporter
MLAPHRAGEEAFGGRQALSFALLFLALLADGFDLQAMAFAAPGLVREWGTSRAALAPALSAGLVGVLIGAPLFGLLGDRIGRKRTIVLGSVVYGLFCLATAAANTIEQLIVLRFLTGIGLGGVLPNVIAQTAELATGRLRPLLTALVTVGISLGGVTVGLVAAAMGDSGAWRTLFVIGGVVPLIVAGLVMLLLPESRAFLAERERVAEGGPTAEVSALFDRGYRGVTPFVWVMFAGLLMTVYLLTSWLPLVLEGSGMSARGAAVMNTILQFGGAVGGVMASLLLGRLGLKLTPILLGIAWLTLLLLAFVPVPEVALGAILGLCGICVIGGQTAINASAGLIYPASIRARGVGSALGVGRLGSIAGPFLGAALVGLGAAGRQDLFFVPLVPIGIAFVAAIILTRRARI